MWISISHSDLPEELDKTDVGSFLAVFTGSLYRCEVAATDIQFQALDRPEGREGGEVHTTSTASSNDGEITPCDLPLFLSSYLDGSLPCTVDSEITAVGARVDQSSSSVVIELTLGEQDKLEIAVKPISDVVPVQSTTLQTSFLNVIHLPLATPINPLTVASALERFAEFLQRVEQDLDGERITQIFTRKWVNADGSIGDPVEKLDQRAPRPDDDTPPEFAATNCDTVLYQRLYKWDTLPVELMDGLSVQEIWVNEHQRSIMHRAVLDDDRHIDLAIQPKPQRTNIETTFLCVSHSSLEFPIDPEFIGASMNALAKRLESHEPQIKEEEIKSIFTRKRLKELGNL